MKQSIRPMKTVFDMETQDPDDYLTLLLLLGHPKVNLVAVTITPGSAYQVGLVKRTLALFGREDVRVGANNITHPKSCVSSWHERAYGEITPDGEAEEAGALLAEVCDGDTTLITGAPLKNLGEAMKHPNFTLGRWVAQGGFAGEGVVPADKQLPKFKGMKTVATFNFNGAPQAALRAFEHEGIGERRCVSKNVCHGVVYTEQVHQWLEPRSKGARHLEMIWQGMEAYLAKKRARMASALPRVLSEEDLSTTPEVRLIMRGSEARVVPLEDALAAARSERLSLLVVDDRQSPCVARAGVVKASADEHEHTYGKKFHDPLAACCAIDPSIGEWAEVELYRERGQWGSRLRPGSGTKIIVDYDHERFLEVFSMHPV